MLKVVFFAQKYNIYESPEEMEPDEDTPPGKRVRKKCTKCPLLIKFWPEIDRIQSIPWLDPNLKEPNLNPFVC